MAKKKSKKRSTISENHSDTKTTTAKARPFDLDKWAKIKSDFDDLQSDFDKIPDVASIHKMNGKSDYYYKDASVFRFTDSIDEGHNNYTSLLSIKQGCLLSSLNMGLDHDTNDDYSLFIIVDQNNTVAILADNGIILFNADDNNAADVWNESAFEKSEIISVSFLCITHLVRGDTNDSDKSIAQMLQLFGSKKLRVLDATQDERQPLTAAQKKGYVTEGSNPSNHAKWRNSLRPPEAGFTLIFSRDGRDWAWHKSATVLLRYTDGKTDKTFLLGQDEGTYFGVELADNPDNIIDAYISLMPEVARKAKGVLRQGEWFAIPVNKKEVPKITSPNCLAFWDNSEKNVEESCFVLPIEDEDSNRHMVYGEARISKSGEIYSLNFVMQHPDHANMSGLSDQWYKFARNTAKASYSMEGVD